MNRLVFLFLVGAASGAHGQTSDPRLREIQYDPGVIVTVPVLKGVVTHIVLDADESITDVASGLGADCAKPEATWCVAAQAGGRNIFVKAKSAADRPNNLAVVTDKRVHSFRLVLGSAAGPSAPVYRVAVHAPRVRVATALPPREAPIESAATEMPAGISPRALVDERLRAAPTIVNSSYSIAEGDASDDIVPTLVFDDGRFTYLRFPGNRELPAVFHVLPDGSETLVNVRMEGELLVVDRVSRRLMLRAGTAVVGVWNDAFDNEGTPPTEGTTVAGVRRTMNAASVAQGIRRTGNTHD